jgi:hypothetical protein
MPWIAFALSAGGSSTAARCGTLAREDEHDPASLAVPAARVAIRRDGGPAPCLNRSRGHWGSGRKWEPSLRVSRLRPRRIAKRLARAWSESNEKRIPTTLFAFFPLLRAYELHTPSTLPTVGLCWASTYRRHASVDGSALSWGHKSCPQTEVEAAVIGASRSEYARSFPYPQPRRTYASDRDYLRQTAR